MKKKFLKFCSVLLCVINLFSSLSTEAVKYTITLGKEEDREIYFISVKCNNPEQKEKKLNIAKVPYGYKKFFNQGLTLQEIDTKNIRDVRIKLKVERALKKNKKKIDSSETIDAILKQFFYKTFNKTMVGYIDQQERAKGRKKNIYVAQKLTNLIPQIFKLPTPFGEAEMEFRHGSEKYYDVFIKDNISTDYKYLCSIIDAFVNNKKEFAKIIQDYLELEYNPKYDDKDLFNTLEQIRSDEQLKKIQQEANAFLGKEENFFKTNDIIEKLKNFKNDLEENEKKEKQEKTKKRQGKLTKVEMIEELIGEFEKYKEEEQKQKEYDKPIEQSKNQTLKKELKKVANVLSAVLFVSEPGPNRAFDGGKSARSPLKYIIDDKYAEHNYSFWNVFVDDNKNGPLYPVAVKNGTEIARILRSYDEKQNKQGKKQRKNKGKDYCKFEENFSDDEKETVEETKEKIVEKNRIEVQNEFNKWIKSADPEQIEEFTKWLNSRMDKK